MGFSISIEQVIKRYFHSSFTVDMVYLLKMDVDNVESQGHCECCQFMSGTVCMQHHEQDWHVWKECIICYGPIVLLFTGKTEHNSALRSSTSKLQSKKGTSVA